MQLCQRQPGQQGRSSGGGGQAAHLHGTSAGDKGPGRILGELHLLLYIPEQQSSGSGGGGESSGGGPLRRALLPGWQSGAGSADGQRGARCLLAAVLARRWGRT
jgi:hypothetical protein